MTGFSRENGPDMAQLSALRAQDLRQMVAADVGPTVSRRLCNPDMLEQEVSRSAETRLGPQGLGQTSVPESAMHLRSSARGAIFSAWNMAKIGSDFPHYIKLFQGYECLLTLFPQQLAQG